MPVALYIFWKCMLVASVLVFVKQWTVHRIVLRLFVYMFCTQYVCVVCSVEPLLYFHVFCLILSSSSPILFGMCGALVNTSGPCKHKLLNELLSLYRWTYTPTGFHKLNTMFRNSETRLFCSCNIYMGGVFSVSRWLVIGWIREIKQIVIAVCAQRTIMDFDCRNKLSFVCMCIEPSTMLYIVSLDGKCCLRFGRFF